uniref:Dolichol-phosphate mannosyltransferase subunit 3 n=3 Tax=Cyprinus carpio TaxID=7962 RepID=A0A8C1I9G0_CYPCA
MTKLLEWLLGASLIGMAWGLVTFDLLDLQLPPQYRELVWPMPVYLLVVFGCYSLATVGYRVATFNDCEDAAKELQAQIKEAKEDLKKKGLKMPPSPVNRPLPVCRTRKKVSPASCSCWITV